VYLLYVDESGNESDPADRFFVLGGVAVFERVTYFLSQSLEAVQTKHFPGVPPLEFHASPMRTGEGFRRNIPEATRLEVLDDVHRAQPPFAIAQPAITGVMQTEVVCIVVGICVHREQPPFAIAQPAITGIIQTDSARGCN
jgi:hypothetical protein